MLEAYAKKRDFKKTAEPPPGAPQPKQKKQLRFVIQLHAATRLHYDFRLEVEGVLKSWAVPKGPSADPKELRLAVMVEDHPIDYASFEGSIPKGEYGGGQVIIWDEGVYEVDELEKGQDPETEMLKGIEKGKLSVTLYGKKIRGSWALVNSDKSKNWLILKHKDAFANNLPRLEDSTSVRSGRTVQDIAAGKPAVDKREEPPCSGAKKAAVPKAIAPMLPTETDKPFSSEKWRFEVKLDGIRAIAIKDGEHVTLQSRNGNDLTANFPKIADALRKHPSDSMVIDSEIVGYNEEGKPDFQQLMTCMGFKHSSGKQGPAKIELCAFDLLHIDGWNLEGSALEHRRRALENLGPFTAPIRILQYFEEDGDLIYEKALSVGFEGVVAKKLGTPYRQGARTKDWLKIKSGHSDEFLICGYTEGQGGRGSTFGSLVLGCQEDEPLRYCGNVGTGFSDDLLEDILSLLKPDEVKKSPFTITPKIAGKVHWVEPKHLVEVKFMKWTSDRMLRMPSFVKLRLDLDPSPQHAPVAEAPMEAGDLIEALSASKQEVEVEVEGQRIKFTSLDKPMWPSVDGNPAVTKRELILYYAQVAGWMLPHLKDRPLAFVRFPDGVGGESFFQKHWDKGRPESVQPVSIWSSHNGQARDWILCNNKPTLLWLAQLGTVEIHPWYSRISLEPDLYKGKLNFSESEDALDDSALNYPDFVVFDLDPVVKSDPKGHFNEDFYKRTVEVAMTLKGLLDGLKLRSYLKTSGKSGLHVYLPLRREHTYDETRAMAETIGREVMKRKPEDVTMEWQVKKRPEKIFFDHNQNVRGKTLCSAYSLRPAALATVSFPLTWDRIEEARPADFNIRTVLDLLKADGDAWAGINADRQSLELRKP